MNNRSRNNFLFASLTCLGVVLVFVYGLYKIQVQGNRLSQSRQVISDHIAKEASYNKVVNLIDETKAQRQLLSSFFITEKDTVRFISDMENASNIIGVKMETKNLAVTPAVLKDGQVVEPAYLVFGMSFEGGETAIKKYVTLIENIPYQKKITQLTLSKQGPNNGWSGTVNLNILITP